MQSMPHELHKHSQGLLHTQTSISIHCQTAKAQMFQKPVFANSQSAVTVMCLHMGN